MGKLQLAGAARAGSPVDGLDGLFRSLSIGVDAAESRSVAGGAVSGGGSDEPGDEVPARSLLGSSASAGTAWKAPARRTSPRRRRSHEETAQQAVAPGRRQLEAEDVLASTLDPDAYWVVDENGVLATEVFAPTPRSLCARVADAILHGMLVALALVVLVFAVMSAVPFGQALLRLATASGPPAAASRQGL